jgi:hypothetical protein
MNIAYNVNGVDRVGLSYLIQAIGMAHQMQLFTESGTMGKEMRSARALTAWGLFSWQL